VHSTTLSTIGRHELFIPVIRSASTNKGHSSNCKVYRLRLTCLDSNINKSRVNMHAFPDTISLVTTPSHTKAKLSIVEPRFNSNNPTD